MASDEPFVFTWRIENFPMICPKEFNSPSFVLDNFEQTKWRLQIRFYLKKRQRRRVVPKKVDMVVFLVRSKDEYIDYDTRAFDLGSCLEIVFPLPTDLVVSTVKYRSFDKDYSRLIKRRKTPILDILEKSHCDELTLRLTVWSDRKFVPVPGLQVKEEGWFLNCPRTQEYYSVTDDNTSCAISCRPSSYSARSHIDVFQHSFTWLVEDVNLRQTHQSSWIWVESALRDVVSLKLGFHYDEHSKHCFKVTVQRSVPHYKKRTCVKCRMEFVVKDFDVSFFDEDHLFEGGPDDTWVLTGPELGMMKFRKRKKWYDEVLQNTGDLKLQVHIAVSHEGCEIHNTRFSTLRFKDVFLHRADVTLLEDISRMPEHNKDITIEVEDGGTMMAHRSILSAGSPYFEYMFDSALRERITGIVDFSDIMDSETLDVFLRYMYGHPLKLTAEVALNVSKLTHMYEFPDLHELCAEFITSNLTVETVPEALNMALNIVPFFEDQGLMGRVKTFMFNRLPEMLHTPQWKKFMSNYMDEALIIADEMFCRRMESKRSTI